MEPTLSIKLPQPIQTVNLGLQRVWGCLFGLDGKSSLSHWHHEQTTVQLSSDSDGFIVKFWLVQAKQQTNSSGAHLDPDNTDLSFDQQILGPTEVLGSNKCLSDLDDLHKTGHALIMKHSKHLENSRSLRHPKFWWNVNWWLLMTDVYWGAIWTEWRGENPVATHLSNRTTTEESF